MEFESWVVLLLLDGLQRAGFFAAAGQAHSLEQLRATVSTDYARFMAEAVNILVDAGAPVLASKHRPSDMCYTAVLEAWFSFRHSCLHCNHIRNTVEVSV